MQDIELSKHITKIYGGERISCSLYRHGIIHKKMDIKLIQSETINHKYNLQDNYT